MSEHHSREGRNRYPLRIAASSVGLVLAARVVVVLSAAVAVSPLPRPEAHAIVLVAKQDLDMGTRIQAPRAPRELFEVKRLPRGKAPEQAVCDYREIEGKLLKRTLRAGTPVSRDDLLDRENYTWLMSNLPPGMRDLGLRVRNIRDFGPGGASAGLRVDILQIIRQGKSPIPVTRVLKQDVLVLDVDHGESLAASFVTVALPVEDLRDVALAQEFGSRLQLFLSTSRDPKEVPAK
jgi:Flp pilus assembly protein CpaB